jgi:hypothetical protein
MVDVMQPVCEVHHVVCRRRLLVGGASNNKSQGRPHFIPCIMLEGIVPVVSHVDVL